MNLIEIKELTERLRANINKVIVGKEETIDHILIALVSSGHILLEDVPGTGKTLLARTLAESLDCQFKRIQFTPDLLPSDVTGINFYNQKSGEFQFRPGPVFSNIVLADEINRATPRTQSSLLESMEERQVTIDGETRILEGPFMVIATQNPLETQGTFPLPEAQLDRFMLKVSLGYPTKEEGIKILKRFKSKQPFETIEHVATKAEVLEAQTIFSSVHVSDAIYQYIINIVETTRSNDQIELGISPRGSQAMLRGAQVQAILKGRDYVVPDDIKSLMVPIFGHRMILKHGMNIKEQQTEIVLKNVLSKVTVPTEDFSK